MAGDVWDTGMHASFGEQIASDPVYKGIMAAILWFETDSGDHDARITTLQTALSYRLTELREAYVRFHKDRYCHPESNPR